MRLNGIAESAERWRIHLSKKWIGADKPISSDVWRPRCEIMIHHSRTSYLAEVGRAGSQTFGSSFIRFSDNGMVSERRIDLLVDEDGILSALPHELTHVVLADRFGGKRPAPWADEGMATLADTESKLALHHRDCCRALDSGTSFRVHDLLNLRQLTRPEQMATFYGQSVSLSRFLIAKGDPQKLSHFVERALHVGYNRALLECYGIKGVHALEQQWLTYLKVRRQPIAQVAPASEFQINYLAVTPNP